MKAARRRQSRVEYEVEVMCRHCERHETVSLVDYKGWATRTRRAVAIGDYGHICTECWRKGHRLPLTELRS